MAGVIQQEIIIRATPKRVYDALLDSRQFSAFTGGAAAEISRDPGGPMSCFGGMITGRNVELVPDQRIVQAWRVGNWAPGVYSIVSFELKPEGSNTLLSLRHAGFPEGTGEHLDAGWHKMYWEPLQKFLAD